MRVLKVPPPPTPFEGVYRYDRNRLLQYRNGEWVAVDRVSK